MAQRRWHPWHRFICCLLGGIALWLGLMFGGRTLPWVAQGAEIQWPTLQAHPLPSAFTQWQDHVADSEDYWEQLETPNFGALVWSSFPVQVYVEPPSEEVARHRQDWDQVIQGAIATWQPYVPIDLTLDPEQADITIRVVAPPLQIKRSVPAEPEQPPRLEIERVRSAQTHYKLYLKKLASGQTQLIHRCEIELNPRQAHAYLENAVLHELGHALGLWGHSSDPQDTMYFAQVREPTGISDRDLATLLKVYQQPTQLGWFLP